MGTPRFAETILEKIIAAGYNVVAVFTQPDKKIGRKQKIAFSPVKNLAVGNKIKIFQPESLKDNSVAGEIKKINPDLIIVAAYGKILPKIILEAPKYGCINVHASLLPKFRGASPVQGAILEGEKETGITLIRMNEKMDEGDILIQKKIAIKEDNTAQSLSGKLGRLGSEMIIELIPDWISGKIKPAKQDDRKATYCRVIKRDSGKIDWEESAEKIYRKWKAYQPWPGVFTFFREGERMKQLKLIEMKLPELTHGVSVRFFGGAESPEAEKGAFIQRAYARSFLRRGIKKALETSAGEKVGKVIRYNKEIAVQTGVGLVILKKIQPEGKKEMNIEEFLRGRKNFLDTKLE